MIEVEWVGGPDDGARFQMRHSDVVRWAESPPMHELLTNPDATVTEWEAPVRLTRNGYRAYWEERYK